MTTKGIILGFVVILTICGLIVVITLQIVHNNQESSIYADRLNFGQVQLASIKAVGYGEFESKVGRLVDELVYSRDSKTFDIRLIQSARSLGRLIREREAEVQKYRDEFCRNLDTLKMRGNIDEVVISYIDLYFWKARISDWNTFKYEVDKEGVVNYLRREVLKTRSLLLVGLPSDY